MAELKCVDCITEGVKRLRKIRDTEPDFRCDPHATIYRREAKAKAWAVKRGWHVQ